MKASSTTISLFTDVGLLIKSHMQRALKMPFSQCQVLWFVAESGKPNMQDVARHFKIAAPSATFLVEELVRGKYLARSSSAKDRRKVELALTQKGSREFKSMTEKRKQVLSGLFTKLNEEEKKQLDRILAKILAHN